ncbi:hypothetical protein HHK36_015575 [Tetracentron sinense]|uniref:BHLH domain-containing protein n=1 Tax=Tetracentron sinense TaxID=13715 RepID=A0A834Z5F1_TETSI|nr:hypothetical protein HHK36_015575 [Tetracentron sinense]
MNVVVENSKGPHSERETLRGGREMRALERALEWLRPIVGTKSWDYCVVWKLGDDPARYIEWMGCCCGGAESANTKEGADQHVFPTCRDEAFRHPVRTKACVALANLPCCLPLNSGYFNKSVQTRVLIPVVGGLIELFVAEHIPRDQEIIEFVMTQCNISREQETMSVLCSADDSLNKQLLCPISMPLMDYYISTGRQQFLLSETQPDYAPCFEISSTGSFDSGSSCWSQKATALKKSVRNSRRKSLTKSSVPQESGCSNNLIKQEMDLVSKRGKQMCREDHLKVRRSLDGEHFHSKNLVMERNRRNRIRENLFALRALVPKISKMDRLSILVDALKYIEELQKKVKKLQDEIMEMEQEDYNQNNVELEIPNSDGVSYGGVSDKKVTEEDNGFRYFSPTDQNQNSSNTNDMERQMEVQVEVYQIGANEFFLKFFCEKRRGGFTRLMEAINSLGLQVTDVNVTTFKGKVLNILKLEVSMANNEEVQEHQLRDTLFKLAGNP